MLRAPGAAANEMAAEAEEAEEAEAEAEEAEAEAEEEGDGTWVMGEDGRWRWEAGDAAKPAASADECIADSDSAGQLVDCATAGALDDDDEAAAAAAVAAVVAEAAEAVVADADECIAESNTAGQLVDCAIAGALDDLFDDEEETEEARIDRTMAALFASPAELDDGH